MYLHISLQGKVLAKRVAFKAIVREYSSKIWVVAEKHSVQIPYLNEKINIKINEGNNNNKKKHKIE